MKYEVVTSNGDVMGWSNLEKGDPPMGVAYGQMHPTAAYSLLKPRLHELRLRVRPEGEAFFEPAGGVHLEDFSEALGPEGIEVSVLGLDASTYERYFPAHVRAYEEQFNT